MCRCEFWMFLALAGISFCEITNYKRVCYFTSWSIYDHYRKGSGRYTGSNITDPSLCTHYIYSFVGFDVDNKTIIPLDEKRDEKDGYKELLDLKQTLPEIKVILGVGGYGFGVERFINLTQNDEDIEELCNNTVDYLRKWGFDGVDMDWSFPTQRGGYPEDRDQYVALLQKLRSSFERESKLSGKPRLSLSSAVPISRTVVDQGYNRTAIGEAVDFLNMITYDLSGGSDVLSHHAPLYPRADSQGEDRTLNVDWGMRYWAEEVPSEKLILGLPFYARTFLLYNSTLNNVGDIQNGSGSPGPYTQAPGVLSYYEVCKLVKTGIVKEKWDEESNAPYAVSDTEFVTYDNPRSVKIKANFVKDNQYGGINVWELSYDDFGGNHCEAGNYPLLRTLQQTLTQSRDDCPEGSYGKLNSNGCTQCRINFYQPKSNQLDCLSCPLGEITLSDGARGRHECILDCSSGSEFDYVTRQCIPCMIGYYRQKPNSVTCVKCSSGFTTVSTGSTSCVQMPEGYTSMPVHNVTLTFKIKMAVESCDDVELQKGIVLDSVKEMLTNASKRWTGICAESCSNIKSGEVSECTDMSQERESTMEAQILNFVVSIDNIPEEVFNGEVTRSTSSVISEILNKRDQFSDLDMFKLRYEGVESMSSRVMCPLPNHVVQNNECVPCEKGTYFNPITAECTECGYGTYQDKVASDICKSCTGILTTRTRGSDSLEHCVSRCELNPSYCRNGGECIYNDTMIRCKCQSGFEGKRCEKEPGEITDYKRVCYYGSWEIYKTGIYKFTADNIPDLDLCTHYIYSFAGVDPENRTIVPLDEADEKVGYKALTDKKKIKPDIKVILAIGGWTFSALPAFTELVKTDESIDEFCENSVKYLRKWKFDGVDMDWEYPANRGSPPEDKQNYATLLERMRETFEREAEETGKPRLLLSSAVPISKSIVDSGFDRKRLGRAVDFLNLMAYDLYTIFADHVGHHAGLYPRADATGEDLQLNAEWGMGYWAEEVEKGKLILGLPTYSRTFIMNTTVNEPGEWDLGSGVAFSSVTVVRYYEICKKLQDGTWTEGWDDEQSVPFAFTDTEWSGYDNERSVQAKADFVKDNQYGGLMVWQLPADDFPGTSCGKGKYPVIDAMRKSLESSRDECRPGMYGHINRKGCMPCLKNTYQPGHKSTSCFGCPDDLITRSESSTDIKDCISPCDLEPNYCSNGECRSTKTGLQCACSDGYRGRFCDEPMTPMAEPQDSMQKLEIITSTFAAISCLLLLILVVMAIFIYKRWKDSSENYEVKPNGFYQT